MALNKLSITHFRKYNKQQQNIYKRAYIIIKAIDKHNNWNNNVHNLMQLKDNLSQGEFIMVYSKSHEQWINNAKIMNIYIDQKKTKHFIVQYNVMNVTYTKDLKINSKQFKLQFKPLPPKLIVIMVKNQDEGIKLLQILSRANRHQGVALYRSINQQICPKLQMQIENYKVNIVIINCDKNWRPPLYLTSNIDIIIKSQFRVHPSMYLKYIQLLKPTGKLLRIPLFVSQSRVSLSYITVSLFYSQIYIQNCINMWMQEMNILFFPTKIIGLISYFFQDYFLTSSTKDQLEIETYVLHEI